MKLIFLDRFSKYKLMKFHENPSGGSPVFLCGRTDRQIDMTLLIVAFRNFANDPKSVKYFKINKT